MGHLCLQMQHLHSLEVHVSTVSGSTMQTANVAVASIYGCWGVLPAGDYLSKQMLLWSLTLTFSRDEELSLFSTFDNTPLETDILKSAQLKR